MLMVHVHLSIKQTRRYNYSIDQIRNKLLVFDNLLKYIFYLKMACFDVSSIVFFNDSLVDVRRSQHPPKQIEMRKLSDYQLFLKK